MLRERLGEGTHGEKKLVSGFVPKRFVGDRLAERLGHPECSLARRFRRRLPAVGPKGGIVT